jgi:hypothetical protein
MRAGRVFPGESIPNPNLTPFFAVSKLPPSTGVISNTLKTSEEPMTISYSANRRPGH